MIDHRVLLHYTLGIVEKLAGEIRKELGERLGLIDKDVFEFCWIVDFPMYEYADDGKTDFCDATHLNVIFSGSNAYTKYVQLIGFKNIKRIN